MMEIAGLTFSVPGFAMGARDIQIQGDARGRGHGLHGLQNLHYRDAEMIGHWLLQAARHEEARQLALEAGKRS